jgi:hypothetical protein
MRGLPMLFKQLVGMSKARFKHVLINPGLT